MEVKNNQTGTELHEVREVEIWKTIDHPFYDYKISSHGRLMSYVKDPKGVIMKLCPNSSGYLRTSFTINRIAKQAEAHRLVGLYFVPNPLNKPCINHKDGNKLNNYYKNLEWATWGENNIHALNMGLKPGTFGENNKSSKLTCEQV